MSVRQREWLNKEGKSEARWMVDVRVRMPGKGDRRVRDISPVNTRRGAEQHERQIRQALQDGTFGIDVKEVLTLQQFESQFLVYSTNNNKPSAVHAKRLTLKNHLRPYFGVRRLDRILVPTVEAYKAKKLDEGLSPKTINNHLAMLRKLLNLAVEWGELSRRRCGSSRCRHRSSRSPTSGRPSDFSKHQTHHGPPCSSLR